MFPFESNSNFISAIKYPFLMAFSIMNSSGVFLNDLKKDIKFFNSRDFDEISKFSIENLSSIKDFNESCVFIFSISIFLL